MQILELYNFVQGMAPFTLIFGLAVLYVALMSKAGQSARKAQPVAYAIAIIFLILVVLQSFVFTWDTMIQLGQN